MSLRLLVYNRADDLLCRRGLPRWRGLSRSATVTLCSTLMVLILGVVINRPRNIAHAASADFGAALRELAIPPVTNVARLIDLGCRDVLAVTRRVAPFHEDKQDERVIRYYKFRGIDIITKKREFEVVIDVTIPRSSLAVWGVISQESTSLAAVERKFGKARMKGDEAVYLSDHDERAIVTVRLDRSLIVRFEWLCD
jgi:hypothetical protein